MCSQNMHHHETLLKKHMQISLFLFWLIHEKKVTLQTEAPLRLIICGLTVSESTLNHRKEKQNLTNRSFVTYIIITVALQAGPLRTK